MSRTADEIDELLEMPKFLWGSPEWAEDGNNAKLVSSVVDPNGSVIGGLTFEANANIETSLLRGSTILMLDRLPLQRLSYKPGHSHSNGNSFYMPADLRLRKLPPDQTRIHLWADNRRWPTLDNLNCARLLDPEPPTYLDALQLFLEGCGIEAHLPPPPHRPRLEF